MLTESQVEAFARDGFVKGGRVLSGEEIEELRGETLRVIEQRERKDVPQPVLLHNFGKPEAPVWQIVNIWEVSAAFAKLVRHPEIAEEVAQLMGAKEVRLWHDQIQYKPASIGGVNMWHQDSPYWPPLEPKDAQVTAWVALDDADAENGCMSMVPGSHRWGNAIEFLHTIKAFDQMPGEYEGRAVTVRLAPVRKGEVHYHHALTWHGSHENGSGRPRRAIALHYMTERTRYRAGARAHPMTPFIGVADGAKVEGPKFPVVWPRGG